MPPLKPFRVSFDNGLMTSCHYLESPDISLTNINGTWLPTGTPTLHAWDEKPRQHCLAPASIARLLPWSLQKNVPLFHQLVWLCGNQLERFASMDASPVDVDMPAEANIPDVDMAVESPEPPRQATAKRAISHVPITERTDLRCMKKRVLKIVTGIQDIFKKPRTLSFCTDFGRLARKNKLVSIFCLPSNVATFACQQD